MKPTMVILEGPDGGGKSTLATLLSTALGFPVIHTGGPLESREEFNSRVEEFSLNAPKHNMILDRTPYISELVYPHLANRVPFCSIEELKNVISFVDPIIIYCRLSSSFRMREKMTLVPKVYKTPEYKNKVLTNHLFLTDRYDNLMESLGEDVIWYDWEEEKTEILVGQIRRRIKQCAAS